MQNEHDFESEPPYDPDDWGAPRPYPTPKPAQQQGAASSNPPSSPGLELHDPHRSRHEKHTVQAAHTLAAGSVEQKHASSEKIASPTKRLRGPARVVASGPAVVLPHASRRHLFPAVFSRSALFRVGGSDDPAIAASACAPRIDIEAQGGISLTLKGPWPRMRDKAVWEIALEMAKENPNAAAPIPITLSRFAARLGYTDKGSDTLEWIWTSLRRLSLCHVEFNSPSMAGPRLSGHLLLAARETAGAKEIEIDPAFASRLLGEDFQFAIDRRRRATLSTALARWIHDFLSTHSTQSRPFDISYLRALCGYGAKKKRFPADLEKALGELTQKAPGILESYSIAKPTRSSDGWTVTLVCGAEKRRFEQPKPVPKPSFAPRAAGRGGVAL